MTPKTDVRCEVNSLRSTDCGSADTGELCVYHDGVEDTAVAALEALAERFKCRVYLADGLNPSLRFHDETTGEICDGPLGGLIHYIVASTGRGNTISLTESAES